MDTKWNTWALSVVAEQATRTSERVAIQPLCLSPITDIRVVKIYSQNAEHRDRKLSINSQDRQRSEVKVLRTYVGAE